ncbi:endonuclease/exonuclease/phosphatase family protein [Candidatus Daviesbacteria bacterium]|nr:endonuclease/exonuclease/phosphatase family protein [Candidatus Daviesbacteria bacterium]
MKLISLNTWGGRAFAPLMKFIQNHSSDTDIFCFQEVYKSSKTEVLADNSRANLLDDLSKALPNYEYFFCPMGNELDLINQYQADNLDLEIGLAVFWKKSLLVKHKGCNFVLKDQLENISIFASLAVILQQVTFDISGKQINIINTHGFPTPGDKLDSPIRLRQSQTTTTLLENLSGGKILVGDFNLMPNTKSIQMIEEHMRNLISESNIERTRSKLNPHYNKADDQKFADYTFVSEDIKVRDFEVPNIEVSDHLPMILEFS